MTTDPDQAPDGDADLLARLGTDPEAVELLYRRHVAAVAAFVARRLPDADAVADVVSSTFLAAIRGADGFDRRRSPDGARFWLLGIARHEIADHQGRAGRQEALARRDRGGAALSEDETARIDELIDAQRLAPEIQAGLDRLSAPVRDAFVLVAVDGFSQADAARGARHLLRRLAGPTDPSAPAPPSSSARQHRRPPLPGRAGGRPTLRRP